MKPKLRPIHNQVAVLFGATSGIGLETAMKMAGKGAKVVIVGRSQEGLDQAVDQVKAHAFASRQTRSRGNGNRHTGQYQTAGMIQVEEGGAPVMEMEAEQVIGIEADVTNWEQVKSVADQVMTRFGRIDTWVNIAAVSQWALFEDTNPEEFRRVIEVNLVGHAYGAMAALPYMKQQHGGALIFVSSISGRVPVPYQSAYNASKHGLIGLAETLRMELKHTDLPVSVTTILPASVNTPLFEKGRTKIGVQPDPIPPIYDATLVARAILYAAQHPVNELIVGDSGYMITFMRRLAPTLTSNMMGKTGFRKARSNEPKSAQAPDNLYHHIQGYNQVEGEYTPQTRRFSALTWLSTHPGVRLGLLAGIITGFGFLLGTRLLDARDQRRNSLAYRSRRLGHNVAAFLATVPLISSLPMFHRPTLMERATGWLPWMSSRKSLTGRIQKQRRHLADQLQEQRHHLADQLQEQRRHLADRLPDHLPLEKERQQAKKALEKERQLIKKALHKERRLAQDMAHKQRKLAEDAAHKQREMAAERVRK